MVKTLPAVIHIGNHTSVLLIADWVTEENGLKKLKPCIQKYGNCRLGREIEAKQAITTIRLNELASILERFRSTAHALGAKIETVAVPENFLALENSKDLFSFIEKKLWTAPIIVQNNEEIKLTFKALTQWYGNDIVCLRIGENTTELCSEKKELSIPAGVEMLFKQMGPIPGPEYKGWCKEIFKEFPVKAFAKQSLFLVGDVGRALAKLLFNSSQEDFDKMEGFEVDHPSLEQVITRISNLSLELRASLPGLENGRHENILCGLFFLKSLFEKLRVDSFKISLADVHLGLFYNHPHIPS